MADESTPPRRHPPGSPGLTDRPRRRREDQEVEQLLELIRTQTDVIASLTTRVSRSERILMEIADVHFENFNPEEKGAIRAVAKQWLRNEGAVEHSDVRVERWARLATIFSGITAGSVAVYGIGSVIHSLLTGSAPTPGP